MDTDVTVITMFERLSKLEFLVLGLQATLVQLNEDIGTLTESVQELSERIQNLGYDYGDGFEKFDTR